MQWGDFYVLHLTRRELDVSRWLATGCGQKQIAERLVISVETVRTHERSIRRKLEVDNRTCAAIRLKEMGICGP